jgi:iron complex outermembrane receptor protein
MLGSSRFSPDSAGPLETYATMVLTSRPDARSSDPHAQRRELSLRRSRPLVSAHFLAIAFLSLLVTASAWAQDSTRTRLSEEDPWAGVEELLVTGTRSLSEELTGSASVTAFDASTLASLQVENIADIASFTPNLEIVTAGTTSPTLFIRGVGLNDFSPLATGAISVYQDDVPRGSPAILLGRIYDVQEVVVLRGPQGTGPYRNASAGAIKIYPRKPTGEFQASLSGSMGNYDYVDLEGALELPLIEDVFSMRSAFGITKRGGWMKNQCAELPPYEERPVRTGVANSNASPDHPFIQGGASLCGETVTFQGDRRSDVEPGLPRMINDQYNWAVRTIFRLTPELPIDTDWTLNLHYAQVRDDSHAGQQIGIQQLQPAANNARPPDLTERVGSGPLNSAGRTSYADQDIIGRLNSLTAAGLRNCGVLCTTASPSDIRLPALRKVNLTARRKLGDELSDLDQDPFSVGVNRVGKTKNDTYGFALGGDIDLTDTLQLRTISGYEHWKRENDSDLDFTPDTSFETTQKDRGYQVSQEIRLLGQLDSAAAITWEVGGLVVADEVEVNSLAFNQPFQGGPDLKTQYTQNVFAYSAYFDGSWELTETWGIDAGARWNYERKEIDYELKPFTPPVATKEDVSFDSPTGLVRLRYSPTEEITFYGMYNRGWKAGSYNATSNPRKGVTFAKPERIDAFEFGWDMSAFEGRFRLTGSMFYYDYFNYQIFTVESNLSPQPEFVTINANSAEVYGAELEATLTPFDGTFLRVNFGWLESQFLDFAQFQLTSVRDGNGVAQVFEKPIDHTGNRLLNSPQFSVSIIASQTLDLRRFGDLTFRYSGSWKDDTYFDATEGAGSPGPNQEPILSDNMIGEDAFWLHNAGIDYSPRNSGLVVSGWVSNLTNEGYRNFSADLNTFLQTTIHFIGEPRTYGVTVRVDF